MCFHFGVQLSIDANRAPKRWELRQWDPTLLTKMENATERILAEWKQEDQERAAPKKTPKRVPCTPSPSISNPCPNERPYKLEQASTKKWFCYETPDGNKTGDGTICNYTGPVKVNTKDLSEKWGMNCKYPSCYLEGTNNPEEN